jgi:hypothetical protein
VKASDDYGEDTDQITLYLDEAPPPTIDAGEDRTVYKGNTIEFLATVSYTGSMTELEYSWDFDASDGIQVDYTGSWPEVLSPSEQFDEPGKFTVTFSCSHGATEVTDTLIVKVLEHSPGVEVGDELSAVNTRIAGSGYNVYKIELDGGEKLEIKLDVVKGDGVLIYLLKGEEGHLPS